MNVLMRWRSAAVMRDRRCGATVQIRGPRFRESSLQVQHLAATRLDYASSSTALLPMQVAALPNADNYDGTGEPLRNLESTRSESPDAVLQPIRPRSLTADLGILYPKSEQVRQGLVLTASQPAL